MRRIVEGSMTHALNLRIRLAALGISLVLTGCGAAENGSGISSSDSTASTDNAASSDNESSGPGQSDTGYLRPAGPFDDLAQSLMADPDELIETQFTPTVGTIVRVGHGAMDSTFMEAFAAALTAEQRTLPIYVFECPYTISELGDFLDHQRNNTWRDPDSTAKESGPGPHLVTEPLRGGIADCIIYHPIACLSQTEIGTITNESQRLHITHVDLRTAGRDDIGWDPDYRLGPPKVSATPGDPFTATPDGAPEDCP